MRYFVFYLLVLMSFTAFSQGNGAIVDKNKFHSNDVVLKDSKENLLNRMGDPNKVEVTRFSIIDTMYSDVLICNSLIETNKYEFLDKGLWYYAEGDTLKLYMIDFDNKANMKKKIFYNDICLDRNLKMKDIISAFSLIEEEDYTLSPVSGQLFQPGTKNNKEYYLIKSTFPDITLIFDCRSKELRCIDFGYDNGGIAPVIVDDVRNKIN